MQVKKNQIQQYGLDINILRSHRRTIAIQVREAEVFIRVPNSLPLVEIEKLIDKKIGWIRQKVRLQQQQSKPTERRYVSGEQFDFLGGKYLLNLIYGASSNHIEISTNTINLRLVNIRANSKKILAEWYLQEADTYLRQRVRHYAPIIGVQPSAIIVKTYKSRWGSCYSDGRISFNWKIIMAARWVIDYVVVHELCHLVQHNHSPAFWRLVAQNCPQYKQAKDWLKQNGQLLEI